MNYLIIIILCAAALTGCANVGGETMASPTELPSPDSIKNMKPDEDWKRLIKNSRLIVTGQVEEILYVVDEKKIVADKPAPDGIVQLPNMKELVRGVLVRLRIEKTISGAKERKNLQTVSIYVHEGYFSSDASTPRFVKGKKYLVFLSPLEETEAVKESIVVDPSNLSKGGPQFDYKTVFKVTEKAKGYFNLTETNEHIVDEVRDMVNRSE